MPAKERANAGSAAEGQGGAPGRLWRNVLTLTCLSILVAHLALKYLPTLLDNDWPKDGGLDLVGLGLLVLAAIPIVAPHLSSAKLPGGVEFAFREVQRRQRMTEEELAQLRFIVEGFVTDGELQHLKNIQRNEEYRPRAEDLLVLDAELRRLIALRLIERKGGQLGVRTFAVADGNGRRIGEWFQLTPRGLEYLHMRAPESDGPAYPSSKVG